MHLHPGRAARRAEALLYRDIHSPRDLLPELAAALHRQRELVLLTSNAGQYDLAVNLIANLASFGIHHHLLLVDNAELAEHAARRGAIAAVWSSLLDHYTERPASLGCPSGCHDADARASSVRTSIRASSSSAHRRNPECRRRAAARDVSACPPSAASFYRADAVRRLWLLRYHYAARLVGLRYRVLVLDSDSMVLSNPYPALRHMEAAVHPLGMAVGLEDVGGWPDMGVNGGTWYLTGRPQGPVHGVLGSVMRRARAVLDAYPATRLFDQSPKVPPTKPADFLLFDQTLVNLGLLEWRLGRAVALTSSEKMRVAADRAEQRRAQWKRDCCYPAPEALGHPPWSSADSRRSVSVGGGGSGDGGSGGGSGGGKAAGVACGGTAAGASCSPGQTPYGTTYELRLLMLRNSSGGASSAASSATISAAASAAPAFGSSTTRRRAAAAAGSEVVLKAPGWLFASESDRDSRSGRSHASFWGARPPPAAIVHFVCSSWPGSDGRRAAMRLWGRWHAADVYEEAEAAARLLTAHRARGFVSFAAPAEAANPTELMPYLRLLTLVAHATRRTPALPVVRCEGPGYTWVEERVDIHTGWLQPVPKRAAAARPCGWAFHSIGDDALREPLCVQRPLQVIAICSPSDTPPELLAICSPSARHPSECHLSAILSAI